MNTYDTNQYIDNKALTEKEKILKKALDIENDEKHLEIRKAASRSDRRKIQKAQTEGLILIYQAKCNAIKEGVKDYFNARVNEQRIKIKNDIEQANMLYAQCLRDLYASIKDKQFKKISDRMNGLMEIYADAFEKITSQKGRLPESVIERSLKRLDHVYDEIENEMQRLNQFTFEKDELLK